MSLRRRITAAVALAVAAVAVTLGVTGYLSTRSHLIGEVQHQLEGPSPPSCRHTLPDRGSTGPSTAAISDRRCPASLDSAAGRRPGVLSVRLPERQRGRRPRRQAAAAGRCPGAEDRQNREAAASSPRRGCAASTSRCSPIGDPNDHYAVEVALPLTAVDSVVHALSLTYGLLVGGGVLLAGLLGAASPEPR